VPVLIIKAMALSRETPLCKVDEVVYNIDVTQNLGIASGEAPEASVLTWHDLDLDSVELN